MIKLPVQEFINDMQKQVIGKVVVDVVNGGRIFDAGHALLSEVQGANKTLNYLSEACIIDLNEEIDRYISDDNEIDIVNIGEFGSAVRVQHFGTTEAIKNKIYDVGTEGYDALEQLTKVYKPKTEERYFDLLTTWRFPITKFLSQLQSAFNDEASFMSYFSNYQIAMENSREKAIDSYKNGLRNTMMATKFHNNNYVDVSTKMLEYLGDTHEALTIEEQIKMPEFYRALIECIGDAMSIAKEWNIAYEEIDDPDFPTILKPEKANFLMLDKVERGIEQTLYANTYHEKYFALPRHKSITSWQGIKSTSNNTPLGDIRTLSTIATTLEDAESVEANVEVPTINEAGFLGVIYDPRALRILRQMKEAGAWQHPYDKYINEMYSEAYMSKCDLMYKVIVLKAHDIAASA